MCHAAMCCLFRNSHHCNFMQFTFSEVATDCSSFSMHSLAVAPWPVSTPSKMVFHILGLSPVPGFFCSQHLNIWVQHFSELAGLFSLITSSISEVIPQSTPTLFHTAAILGTTNRVTCSRVGTCWRTVESASGVP